MATPSIAMIPSGYKATKVYSVLPTNGDGDLTFARNNTGTRVNKSGLIEVMATDVPRLDYSDGSCPSLLLETASINLALYSQEFSDTSWSKTDSTLTPNTVISPDGTLTASTLTSTGSSAQIAKNSTGVSGSEYTVSFYIKRKTGSGSVAIKAVENIDTNISVTNEWKRFSFTATATSTNIFSGVRLFTTGDEVYIWGAQVEEKSFATSYIPTTNGTASRSQDSVSKTGLSSYISSTAGVLYAELSTVLSTDPKRISLSDGSSLNRVEFGFDVASNRFRIIIKDNNNDIVNGSVDISTDITNL